MEITGRVAIDQSEFADGPAGHRRMIPVSNISFGGIVAVTFGTAGYFERWASDWFLENRFSIRVVIISGRRLLRSGYGMGWG